MYGLLQFTQEVSSMLQLLSLTSGLQSSQLKCSTSLRLLICPQTTISPIERIRPLLIILKRIYRRTLPFGLPVPRQNSFEESTPGAIGMWAKWRRMRRKSKKVICSLQPSTGCHIKHCKASRKICHLIFLSQPVNLSLYHFSDPFWAKYFLSAFVERLKTRKE